MPKVYEFFAGGGMARAGLGPAWECIFANDFDPMKGRTYAANWGSAHLVVDDINNVPIATLPGIADLAWASFPCQDVSLAGNYEGIGHRASKERTRSGAFWSFWSKIRGLAAQGRAPAIVVLENVFGVLTSNAGGDFAAIGSTLSGSGYRFGAVVADASLFLPQSRPRVFIVAIRSDVVVPTTIVRGTPDALWHPVALRRAHDGLSNEAKRKWIWWSMPVPAERTIQIEDIVEDYPSDVEWHDAFQTSRLVAMMDATNRKKLERVITLSGKKVGTVYRRTRLDADGVKCQRAEVRFDGTAGCLRTPSGGSSRQTIIVVEDGVVKSRLLSGREAARLMGLPDTYVLPNRYNDAYHVAGDGIAVPVVSYLRDWIFDPIVGENTVKYLNAAE